MSFHEVLFPPAIAYGASGGPKFKTAVFTADSGHEQRTLDWKDVRAEYDVSHTVKNPTQRDELTDFFMNRRGMAYGFRFKDWNDYTIQQEVIGLGDSVTRSYQITKLYTSDQGAGESWTYQRKLTKIAWGTIAGVTVGGVAAKRCYDANYFDAGVAVHAYILDENTGQMLFRDAPTGKTYDGTTPATALTLIAGVNFGVLPINTTGPGVVADWDAGYQYLKGVGASGNGIRRLRLSDGVEDLQTSSDLIAFPSTSAQDDQEISGVIAAHEGCVFVAVGGANTQVLYKLDGADFSILDSYGVGSNSLPAGNIGEQGRAGVISNDGTRLMCVNLLGGATSFPIFATSDLTPLGTASVGTVLSADIEGGCPLYDSGFAILLTRSGKVEMWDDAGNKLAVLGSGTGNWMVWDGGSQPGVVIKWTDAANNHFLSKYLVDTQSIVWTTPVPATSAYLSPCSRVADRFCYSSGTQVIHVDTVIGDFAVRPITAGSVVQAYDVQSETIASYPANGRMLDTDIAGVTLSTKAEVKIGYGEFHVPVRFDTDHLEISHDHYNVTSWSGIPLIEVRDWSEINL